MKPSSKNQAAEQRRCEICGDRATDAVTEHDGMTQRQHAYCARCAAGGSEDDLLQMIGAIAAEQRELLGEREVEARQSSSWTAVEQFLADFQQPGGRAKAATEEEKRRIAPRVARMASRLDGEMPETVRDFLTRYGSLAG